MYESCLSAHCVTVSRHMLSHTLYTYQVYENIHLIYAKVFIYSVLPGTGYDKPQWIAHRAVHSESRDTDTDLSLSLEDGGAGVWQAPSL
jgi:hypothetical protein